MIYTYFRFETIWVNACYTDESQLDVGSTLDGQGSGTNTWRVILVATVYAPRALSMGMHHIAHT